MHGIIYLFFLVTCTSTLIKRPRNSSLVLRKRIVTQKDIAKALNISRGTVDRALHNRKGISKATKALVRRKVEEIGYSPNRIAQFLVTGRKVNVAMITPGDPLWEMVRKGAHSYLSELEGSILNINWYETNVHDPVHEAKILKKILRKNVDGIGIAPADPDLLCDLIDNAVETSIPVVTLNTDAPQSKRLCYVGQDPILAGKIAGELMGKFLMGSGNVVIITAFKNVLIHKHRLSGFVQKMSYGFPKIRIGEVYENHDSSEEAYLIARQVLQNGTKIDGIYLTTGNGPVGVAKALREVGKAGSTKVICFDFFNETVRLLKEEIISAAIGEDPFSQGYQSVKILFNYIVDGKKPSSNSLYTKIDIGLRENIDSLVS